MEKTCTKCLVSKPLDAFSADKKRRDGRQFHCKACNKAYYDANRAKILEEKKRYHEENRDEKNEKSRQWGERNPDRKAALHREWYQSLTDDGRAAIRPARAEATKRWRRRNPAKVRADAGARRATQKRATVPWSNNKAIEQYYLFARYFTEEFGIQWDMDHVVPMRSPIVCGFHSEHNMTFMPAAWNNAKSNKVWPDMPAS